MSWRPFAVALLLPVVVTGLTLASVARNRAGGRGPITLTEREVYLSPRDEDNTAATVWLSWHAPPDPEWPGRERLARLGFDMRVDPDEEAAADHYGRMLPRKIFVALELDGPAFAEVIAALERDERAAPRREVDGDSLRTRGSRLVVVDVDRDAEVLSRRYPDPRTHLVTAATISVWHARAGSPGRFDRIAVESPTVGGSILSIEPNRMHVPLEWAARLPDVEAGARRFPQPFEIDLRYGTRYEPWVTAVRIN